MGYEEMKEVFKGMLKRREGNKKRRLRKRVGFTAGADRPSGWAGPPYSGL